MKNQTTTLSTPTTLSTNQSWVGPKTYDWFVDRYIGASLFVYRPIEGGKATILSAPFRKGALAMGVNVPWARSSRSGLSANGQIKFAWNVEVREIELLERWDYKPLPMGQAKLFRLSENTNGAGHDVEAPIVVAFPSKGADSQVHLHVQAGLFNQFDWTDFNCPKLIEQPIPAQSRLAGPSTTASMGLGQVAEIPIANGDGKTWTLESRLGGKVSSYVVEEMERVAFATCVAGWDRPVPSGMAHWLGWECSVGDMLISSTAKMRWDGTSPIPVHPGKSMKWTHSVDGFHFYSYSGDDRLVIGPDGQDGNSWSEFHWSSGFSDHEAIDILLENARYRAEQAARWAKEQDEQAERERSERRESACAKAERECSQRELKRIEHALATKDGAISVLGNVLLSLEDSGKAGNCSYGTEQWMEEMGLGGRTEVKLSEIPKDAWYLSCQSRSRFINVLKHVYMNKKSKKA